MTAQLSRWQRPDGFPRREYFDAIEDALEARGIDFTDSWRDEDWDYTLELWDDENSPEFGPMRWATHGLYVTWRVDEDSKATHADDFGHLYGDVGWSWVPYTQPAALGNYSKPFELRYLAEPDEVAAAVHQLLTTGSDQVTGVNQTHSSSVGPDTQEEQS
ncbi:MAG: hypothetical protein J2P19_00365 [Pseudonocardia sp.]|nr:hypothetical protein [Pseudonocardia sp.]